MTDHPSKKPGVAPADESLTPTLPPTGEPGADESLTPTLPPTGGPGADESLTPTLPPATRPSAADSLAETLLTASAPMDGKAFMGMEDTLPPPVPAAGFDPLAQLLGVGDTAVGATTHRVQGAGGRWDQSTGPVERLVGYEQRYEAGEELGRGGLGRVYLAYDRQLGREVAIKELHADLSSSKGLGEADRSLSSRNPLEVRFLDEARVTAQLEHPGIAPVYELGQREDGSIYYAMRRVRGRTLAAAIRGRGWEARLELLPHYLELCHAIAYAHSRGVIHRDLKTENVMLGDFGETVVLDWGLAKVRGKADRQLERLADDIEQLRDGDAMKTVAGQAMGTPAYMPPEQAKGELAAIDERSDVYSLGAILYEILTGQPPHLGPNVLAVLAAVVEQDARAPQELEPNVPPELAAVALRALARDPAARYPSAKELAQDVRRFQVGGLVRAHAYSSWELVGRWLRRHRAALLTVLAFLIVAGGVWWYRGWSGERFRRATELTRQAKVSKEVEAVLGAVAAGPKEKNWLELYTFKLIALREPLVERQLMKALGHPEARVRRVAARALGGMKSARAVPALIDRLAKGVEPSETVVVDVVNALGIIGDPRADRPVDEARWRYGQHGSVWKQTALAYQMIPLAPLPAAPTYDQLVNRGRSLVNKGRSRSALPWLDRAVAADPRRTRALVNRAVVHMRHRDYSKALKDLDRVLVLDPQEHMARHNRAIIYRHLRRYDEAIPDLNRVVKAGVLPAVALRNRAWVHRLRDDLVQAERDYRAALVKDPKHVASRVSLAGLLAEQGRLKEAVAEVERAIRQQPRYTHALTLRADLRRYAGDLSGALADAEALIAVDPVLSWGYRHRGRIRLARGDRAGATADFDRAVGLAPRSSMARAERALYLHLAAGDYAAAEADLRVAVALARKEKKGHEVYYEIYRIHVLLRLRRTTAARRALAALRPSASRRANQMMAFLRGEASQKDLEQALLRNGFHKHYVVYYQGLKAELQGDLAGARAAYARIPGDWPTQVYVPTLARVSAAALAGRTPDPTLTPTPAPAPAPAAPRPRP